MLFSIFFGLSQKLSVFSEQTEKYELRPQWQEYLSQGVGIALASSALLLLFSGKTNSSLKWELNRFGPRVSWLPTRPPCYQNPSLASEIPLLNLSLHKCRTPTQTSRATGNYHSWEGLTSVGCNLAQTVGITHLLFHPVSPQTRNSVEKYDPYFPEQFSFHV